MKARLEYNKVDSKAIKGLLELEKYIHSSEIELSLIELVKMRASQINGCAFCLDMHAIDARNAGETEQRLHTLIAWRDTPFFTEREKAALEWTEALTEISLHEIDDELYDLVSKEFSETELLSLTMVIIAINSWNRLAIPFKNVPGNYKPQK